MTRPVYETTADRQRQLAVANHVLSQFTQPKRKLVALPRLHPADYAITKPDGQIIVMLEVKCRRQKIEVYPSLILSARKVSSTMTFCDHANIAYCIAADWADAIGIISVTAERMRGWRCDMGGRTDRGDSDDIEPVFHIPVSDFKRLPWPLS